MVEQMHKYHHRKNGFSNTTPIIHDDVKSIKITHKIPLATSMYIKKDSRLIDNFLYHCSDWCFDNIGYRVDIESIPEVEWVFNQHDMKTSRIYGYYFYAKDMNTILIRISGHRTWVNLARTLIHEWVHYLQSPVWISRYNNTHKYEENPYEITADYYANSFCNQCATYGWRKINAK